jgi:hypothetical protein
MSGGANCADAGPESEIPAADAVAAAADALRKVLRLSERVMA